MADEEKIIRAVLNDDIDRFGELVELHQKPVVRMIRNFINDHHSCEDIAQEVFLAAYKKLDSFDPAQSSFSTWILTIARNKSINAVKKKKPILAENLPEQGSFSAAGPSRQQEIFSRLNEALKSLPLRQRMAFVLAEFEKLPYEQIAQIEGTRLGTIKSRINRAKKKLRFALKEFQGKRK